MKSEPTSEMTKNPEVVESLNIDESEPGHSEAVIYIDPKKEVAALRKFDKFLLPVAFLFLVLSSLDRSNVSKSSSLRIPPLLIFS